MSAKQLMLPANHITVRGLPASGATASLYTTGTTTPQPFYSDSGLTISLGSTITANAVGTLPDAYQESTTPFRLILKDKTGATLDGGDIDPFYFGQTIYSIAGSASVATRTLLATSTGTSGSIAHLAESGREGAFVWDSSNLSAKVTADPQQGVYVAPASDTTGASGAWVRKFDGPLNVKWFGAKGDGTTNDYTAIQAALTYAQAGDAVYIPPTSSYYVVNTRLVITAAIRLIGGANLQDAQGVSHPAADKGSTLYFAAGIGGILVKYINDSDVKNSTAIYPGGSGTIIENLRVLSAGNRAVAAGKYGIESRATITIRNVEVSSFGDHGVAIRASTGSVEGALPSDGIVFGNANRSNLTHVTSKNNAGDGIRIEGSDANVITVLNCAGISNLGWDFYDNALIGNSYIGCDSESGGSGSYTNIRVDVPHTYENCHTEGALADLKRGCTVIGGSLGQSSTHVAGSLAFIMTGGTATRYPYLHVATTYGGTSVGVQMGSKDGDSAMLKWGQAGGYADWKFQFNPPGSTSGSYGFNYAASSIATFMCWPDGTTRSGRLYAPEFPRGICIGDQTNNAGSRDKLIITGTAAPGSGTWQQGDLVINTAPSANGVWAWVCTTAGTPGTWQAMLGVASALSLAGAITSSSATAGVGYAAGAGGTVTQATSKSTGVTLNKVCGQITMNNAALAAAALVSFTVTNSAVAATDTINLNLQSGNVTAGTYRYWVDKVSAGSFVIAIENRSAGSLSEALVFNFAVIKAVAA